MSMTVPTTLATRPQWVLWRNEPKADTPGEFDKVPYSAGGRKASSTDPRTWATLSTVRKVYARGGYTGLGYVFSGKDGLVGIDLDDCRNPETGTIDAWALDILDRLATYCEVSPSLTGVKAWAVGTVERSLRTSAVEVYGSGRYFTFTGMALDGYPAEPQPAQEAIDYVLATHRPAEPERRPATAHPAPLTSGSRHEAYALAAMTAECNAVTNASEGGRNNQLNESAFSLGQLVGGRLLDEDDTADNLLGAALRAGLSAHEASRTIRSGMRAGMQNPRELPPERPALTSSDGRRSERVGGGEVASGSNEVAKVATPPRYRFLVGDEIDTIRPPRWLVRGYMALGAVTVVYGPSESGKTPLLVDIAERVAQHHAVIYVAAEDAAGLRARMRAWELHHQVARGNFIVQPESIPLASDEAVDRFIAQAMPYAPRLIVIDTLNPCIAGLDENSNSDMGMAASRLIRIAETLDAHVAVLHHPTKDGASLRGASAILNNTSAVWQVEKGGDDMITLRQSRNKQGGIRDDRSFRILVRPVDFVDDRGEQMTSVVLLPAAKIIRERHEITKAERDVLRLIVDAEDAGEPIITSDLMESAGYKRHNAGPFYRMLKHLKDECGYIEKGDKARSPYTALAAGRKALTTPLADRNAENGADSWWDIAPKIATNTSGSKVILEEIATTMLPDIATTSETHSNAADDDCYLNATSMLPPASIATIATSPLGGGSNGSNQARAPGSRHAVVPGSNDWRAPPEPTDEELDADVARVLESRARGGGGR
jgi:hypothetical protein